MTDNTVIVSMTSWPPRMGSVREAFDHILSQVGNHNVHCVLVLSEDEFPAREEDICPEVMELITNGSVELIWDRGNIRSHKKLMPVLERYPDNAIIIVDDDMGMAPGWLDAMLSDHAEYPEDIIYGQSSSCIFLDSQDNIVEVRCPDADENKLVQIRGARSSYMKPANGACGTLYPAHTFTRPEFFNRELFMAVSPSSDETWQFAFAMMEGRRFRALSSCNKPFCLRANYDVALYHTNSLVYNLLHNRIAELFPEYKETIRAVQPKVIVSMASYGKRLQYVGIALTALLHQSVCPTRIVLNVSASDIELIPADVRYLISTGQVELFVVPEDFHSHNKYYWSFVRFPGDIIITVDDDIIYDFCMISKMLAEFRMHPNCVIGGKVRRMNDKAHYSHWSIVEENGNADVRNMAIGCGAILYPPYAISDLVDIRFAAKNFPIDDDVYLRYLENMRILKVRYAQLYYTNIAAIQYTTPTLFSEGEKRTNKLIKKYKINIPS